MIKKDNFKRKLPEPSPIQWVPGIYLPFKCTFYPIYSGYLFIKHLLGI